MIASSYRCEGAVVDRLFVDLDSDGRVSVSTWPEGRAPGNPVGPAELVWPLDTEALDDLRWYLEEYLLVPFGVYGDKGPKVAAKLRPWGEAVFDAVFGAGPARDIYAQQLASLDDRVELVFRSADPNLLGLPWELMWQPGRPSPAALDQALVTRSLPDTGLADPFEVPGERLRVLMVISRPEGPRDVPYQLIARRLTACVGAVRGDVDLVVLRPPTLESLTAELSAAQEAGEPFQVVHFDGHGALPRQRDQANHAGERPVPDGSAPEGVLLFETPTGGRHSVSASAVARVLADAMVPLVVLNACQSGAVGAQVEAAVATRLLSEGVASVVAMAYSVFTDAAAEFMAAFYDRLFAGDPVSEAVAAGRRWMADRPLRTSVSGRLELQDWMVPVHYARRPVHFTGLRTQRPGGTATGGLLDALRNSAGDADQRGALASSDTFVGRDGVFYELETALRHQHVALLHGPAGCGKTELARAFGRWWQDTRGVERPEWVVWQSFTPGAASLGLDQVISEIGRNVIGLEFARLEPGEQRRAVEALLAEQRLLLIWDDFESVRSMPDPATPRPETGAQDELRAFIEDVAAGGRSALIITSRNTEAWLGPVVRHVPVGGLTFTEANEYTDVLLAGYPNAQARRGRRDFGDLTEWLGGHPMSMKLVLPHLDTTDPGELLAGLRGIGGPAPWNDTEADGDRNTSLAASLAYSYRHIGPGDRSLLSAVSLFHSVVDVNVLAVFSQVAETPQQFRLPDHQGWASALERAADDGLLTAIEGGMYQVHPALPAFLAQKWRTEAGPDYDRQRAGADAALQTAHVALAQWLFEQIRAGDAGLAYSMIERQRRTLGAMLAQALDNRQWDYAYELVRPLDAFWTARGMAEGAREWVQRARLALESPTSEPPDLQTPAGQLWVYLVGSQANSETTAGRLDRADQLHRQIDAALDRRAPPGRQRSYRATQYHELGVIALRRGDVDEAERWFQRSLAIEEELGNRRGMAISYQQLGRVAGEREHFDDAEQWYRRSLAIKEELGDRRGMEISYYQLGRVALSRNDLGAAERWYAGSLAISEELGDRSAMASGYQQLGAIAQVRGELDAAEQWYHMSLTMAEELGDRPAVSDLYHQLGAVAHDRRDLDGAEQWFRMSLTISEELGDRPRIAFIYSQLARLAEQRGNPTRALDWAIRCVALFDEFGHPATRGCPDHLARLTAQLGLATLEERWQHVTGSPVPRAARDFVTAYEQQTAHGPEGTSR